MQGNDADKAVNTGVQGGFDIRTDLALEQRGTAVRYPGLSLRSGITRKARLS